MNTILVRRRDVVSGGGQRAGAFAEKQYLKGVLPKSLLAVLGVYCVDTRYPWVALTYDDGPDPTTTPGVLNELSRRGARATFFVLGEQAEKAPDLVRRIVDDGHELALHGMNHRSFLTMNARQSVQSIMDARKIVEDIAGRQITLFRPPYGSYTFRQALAFRRLGLELMLWSGDALDWIDDSESAVAGRAIEGIFPGGIILLHDTRADPETLGAGEQLPAFDRAKVLGRILDHLDDRGYTTLTTSELLARAPSVRSIEREIVFSRASRGK